MADKIKTLYLIDISSFIFRAFYGIRVLNNKKGEPTNAVYGVATMLERVCTDAKPEYMAAVFDSREPSVRKEIYSEYKANRVAPPDDLVPQFARIEQLVGALKLPALRKAGYEADDVIAALCKRWLARGDDHTVCVVTGDKDLLALVGPRVSVWDTMKEKKYDADAVVEKMGVRPEQVTDFLSLVGDSSDNIPGVPSIGPKTASELLAAHGTLEGVLEAAAAGKIAGKRGTVIHEHREDALLSRQLATLQADVDPGADENALHFKLELNEDVATLFHELDFKSLLERWQKAAGQKPASVGVEGAPIVPRPSVAAAGAQSFEFKTIWTETELAAVLESATKRGQLSIDLETTSLKAVEAEIVGFALATDSKTGFYVPVGHRQSEKPQLKTQLVLDRLKPLLTNPRLKLIGQNLKYDFSVLMAHGIEPQGLGADTMVAGYVLDPSAGRFSLETLAARYLDYRVTTFEEVTGKGKSQLGFDQVTVDVATRYSAEDAVVSLKLWETLCPPLAEQGLMEIFARVDLPLVPVLARMETVGVAIDTQYLKNLSLSLERELLAIEERIRAFSKGPINLNSPKQLARFLFEDLNLPVQSKTKTGPSTDYDTLDKLAPMHEVPRLLIEYREISKLKGTYVDTLPGMVHPKTGRIHAGFHQTGTATGRISSSDPNLQNIPVRSERGQAIRRAFIAAPGMKLLSVDYSQIELRLLAHMSGDPDLVDAFQRDADVHTRTAAQIFNVPPEGVTQQQREAAKAINFGLMYGKTAFGLAAELRIPQGEARKMIQAYFERYRGVKTLLDSLVRGAYEKGYTTSLLGRRRNLPELKAKNPAVRANGERMAMNSPVQGTAADMIKLAMIELDERLRAGGYRSRLIIQVHDELVLECPDSEVAAARDLVEQVMEGAMKLSVPLRVQSSVGSNWNDVG